MPEGHTSLPNKPTEENPSGLHEERHYSPAELADLWGLSTDTIRKLFENEPGVIAIGDRNPRRKRRYITLRIPESVVARVHRRISAK